MDSSDLALAFVDSCCYVGEGLSVPVKEFWEAYRDWSVESNLRCLRRRDLLSRVEPYFRVSSETPMQILGVYLKDPDEWEWWNPEELRKVYLISNGRHVKIGVSVDPLTRMEILQIGSSDPLSLVHCWPGGYEEEAALHKRFQAKRVRGEWFALTEQEVLALCEKR